MGSWEVFSTTEGRGESCEWAVRSVPRYLTSCCISRGHLLVASHGHGVRPTAPVPGECISLLGYWGGEGALP